MKMKWISRQEAEELYPRRDSMGITMTIKDTDNVTMEDLLQQLPHSKAAKEYLLLQNHAAALDEALKTVDGRVQRRIEKFGERLLLVVEEARSNGLTAAEVIGTIEFVKADVVRCNLEDADNE